MPSAGARGCVRSEGDREWTIDNPNPGAAARPLRANSSLHVTFGEDVCKLDPRTGALQRQAKLPLPGDAPRVARS